MKNILPLFLAIAIIISTPTFGQQSKINLKLNLLAGFGTTWHTLDFSDPSTYENKKVAFSGGGGVGVEAGMGYKITPLFITEFSASIQQVMGVQSVNGYASSVFFNKKSFLAGAKYKIPLSKKELPLTLNFGGGAGLVIPGQLKITENDDYLGSIGFKNAFTVYGVSELEIPFRKVSLIAGLRFKKAKFPADSFSKGNVETLSNEYRNFAGTGFDLYAGLSFNL